MGSSLPINGQWFLCEHSGPRNCCCILGQTAAAVQIFWVSYLCTKHWLSISAGRISVSYSRAALIFCFWENLELPLRYWLPNGPCTNLTVQEAAFHSMSGLGPFTPCLIFPCAHHSRIAAYRTWKLVWNNLLSLILLTAHHVEYAFYQLCYGLTGLLTSESLCKQLGETWWRAKIPAALPVENAQTSLHGSPTGHWACTNQNVATRNSAVHHPSSRTATARTQSSCKPHRRAGSKQRMHLEATKESN